jgi:hypothetical protein
MGNYSMRFYQKSDYPTTVYEPEFMSTELHSGQDLRKVTLTWTDGHVGLQFREPIIEEGILAGVISTDTANLASGDLVTISNRVYPVTIIDPYSMSIPAGLTGMYRIMINKYNYHFGIKVTTCT